MKKFQQFMISILATIALLQTQAMAEEQEIPTVTSEENIKLSFAPPWWMTDYPKFMDANATHFDELKKRGYDTIKLWLAHIQPGFSIPFHTGTFGYKCDLGRIFNRHREACPYYFQAIDALNASEMKIDVEIHPENPKFFGEDQCTISGKEKAIEYGKRMAQHHYDWAFKPFLIAGGKVNTLILDGPLDKIMRYGNVGRGCGFVNQDNAIEATLAYMEQLNYRFNRAEREIDFVYLVNFPHWKSSGISSISSSNHDRKGDFLDVVRKMVRGSNERNLKLVGFEVDNPLTYTLDLEKRGFFDRGRARYTSREMRKLKGLQAEVKRHNLEFRFITITDTAHIDANNFPPHYNAKESKLFTNETTFYADYIRANFGDYLHNVTLQSWLSAPYYIFDENGPARNGMYYNALQVGKRAKGGFCRDLQEYNNQRGISFASLKDAANDYNGLGQRHNIVCMPAKDKVRSGGRTINTCTSYYFLLTHPKAVDHTLNAEGYYERNGGSCKPISESSWLKEYEYKDRMTRIFNRGF